MANVNVKIAATICMEILSAIKAQPEGLVPYSEPADGFVLAACATIPHNIRSMESQMPELAGALAHAIAKAGGLATIRDIRKATDELFANQFEMAQTMTDPDNGLSVAIGINLNKLYVFCAGTPGQHCAGSGLPLSIEAQRMIA